MRLHRRDHWAALLVLVPTVAVAGLFLFGFALWSGWISLTSSTLLPRYDFVGWLQYQRLFAMAR